MTVRVVPTQLAGLVILEPVVREDARGFFVETFNQRELAGVGIKVDFVQDNHSRSVRDTLRGLHYQESPGQAKLVRAARGRIWDVAVDIRPESATFGTWEAVELDDVAHRQLFVPVGFAHGFCVLSDVADVIYKVSAFFDPSQERGIAWNDPDLGISWPIAEPRLSERDRHNPSFAAYRLD